ncbi:hypothetical protein BpHYR1_019356 [Brachionus plicatilis]|uniref:Uncharacterized protein n=1 Tax=Brachionus plicatilis TaxID=10195 RepID=A0A3M7Q0F2_BRAPC|nr:hypothetical protein BpHYR1_019356 [Brachionus plicatilis]
MYTTNQKNQINGSGSFFTWDANCYIAIKLSSHSRVQFCSLINPKAMLPSSMLVSINQRYLLSVPYR